MGENEGSIPSFRARPSLYCKSGGGTRVNALFCSYPLRCSLKNASVRDHESFAAASS